jgi:phosphoglycolate phosphatase
MMRRKIKSITSEIVILNRAKLLIFDWDGTIMDSSDRIVSSMQLACQHLSITPPSHQAVCDIIGLSLDIAIKKIIPGVSEGQVKALIAAYSEQYIHLDTTQTPLYEGVTETMQALKDAGYLLGVATGKSRRGLDRVLAQTELDQFIDFRKGADEANSKPDPLMLSQILTQSGLNANQAFMIGDTSYDLEMAQRINMPSIGVSYGMHSIEILNQFKPKYIADTFPQIEQWLAAESE